MARGSGSTAWCRMSLYGGGGGQGWGVVGLARGARTNTLSEKIHRLTGRKYFLSTTPENNNE